LRYFDFSILQFTTEVVSCTKCSVDDESDLNLTINGQNKTNNNADNMKNLVQVVLKDTIMFPEGGGQVCVTHKN